MHVNWKKIKLITCRYNSLELQKVFFLHVAHSFFVVILMVGEGISVLRLAVEDEAKTITVGQVYKLLFYE